MRFHLTMFFVTIAVSMGMHAIASAAEPAQVVSGATGCHNLIPAITVSSTR